MRIILRDQPAPNTAELVIHMGAGARRAILNSTIVSYSTYVPVVGPAKSFAVSVFGAIDGITTEQILDALPQNQYGTATFVEVQEHFELLPTTIENEDFSADMKAIQPVHFDVVLPHDPALLAGVDPRDLDDPELELLFARLDGPLDRLIALFDPRGRK